jgi:hypothetical protein
VIHPVKKHDTLSNEITEYVADMNIALTYHHFQDDWKDDKSILGLAGVNALKKAYKKINRKYPRQCSEISESLNRLAECEKNNEMNLDTVARCFGELMSALFTYKEDMWEDGLRRMGFYLGKFIYILDAYDDIEKDIKHGSYNPLIPTYNNETFDTDCRSILTLMMAECTREFEKLPCLQDMDILGNILYEGVWTKFDKIKNERTMRKEQQNDSKSI